MILFKGKRVDNGKEVEGFLFKYKHSDSVYIILNEYSADEVSSSGYFNHAWHEVHPDSVQQIGFAKEGIVSKLVEGLKYAENKTYILKNNKKAVSPLFKRDVLKMDTAIKKALAEYKKQTASAAHERRS